IDLEENISEPSNFQTLISSIASLPLTEFNKKIRAEICSISLSLRFQNRLKSQENPSALIKDSICQV
ncbi:hypothetical protein TorRG33x02_140590, partial [Trema orientale]